MLGLSRQKPAELCCRTVLMALRVTCGSVPAVRRRACSPLKCSTSVEQGETEAATPPLLRRRRNSLAAYSSGGVKPAGQNIGPGRQIFQSQNVLELFPKVREARLLSAPPHRISGSRRFIARNSDNSLVTHHPNPGNMPTMQNSIPPRAPLPYSFAEILWDYMFPWPGAIPLHPYPARG